MNLVKKYFKTCIPATAAVAFLAGCHHSEPLPEGYSDAMEFNKPDEVSAVTRLYDTQAAVGARTDGTLRPYHFSDDQLNSLGRQKIDYMLRDTGEGDSDRKLVVYVDVPAGEGDAGKDLAKARQDAVKAYLVSTGRSEASFRLESGFNPNNSALVDSTMGQDEEDAPAAAAAPASAAAAGSFGSDKK